MFSKKGRKALREPMRGKSHVPWVIRAMIVLLSFFYIWIGASTAQEKPRYGGILNYAVANTPPSYDAHRETSFATLHPIGPHYSLLLKFDEDHYPKVIEDLAESWTVSRDNKTYTFRIRKGVKFHDGSSLTARDIKATYDKIIFPTSAVVSVRQALYTVVEKVEAPDDSTVVFRLKWPAASFIATLASPWNWIYKADLLAKDPRWYETNVMGTGPFKFVEYAAGSHWIGKRNEDYFVKGRPYLDGYRAIFIKDAGARVAAIRGGRADIEFRGFSPPQRDTLVSAMGDKVQVKESPWLMVATVYMNVEKKPFDDPRVRRALSLAIDRWEGTKVLSKVTSLKFPGALLRPGSEYAMTEEELTQIAGFSKDIAASRKEARRLLREAGVPEGFSFIYHNRDYDPYDKMGIFLIDQWKEIGLNVTQKVQEAGSHFSDLMAGKFDVGTDMPADFFDEPDSQLRFFLSREKNPQNFSRYNDPVLEDLYQKQSRTLDKAERRRLCNQFQKRILDEKVYVITTFWNNRIIPYSTKVKGFRILPSHHLNMDLQGLWLAQD